MDNIVYFDRYRSETCTEKVYGDAALKWTYGTTLGKLSLHAVVKRAWFSRWYGWRMDRPKSRAKIKPFISDYALDVDDFLCNPDEFANFNQFFARKLKPQARPIDDGQDSVVFPADGRHLCVPNLSECQGLFVKGEMFDLATLLGSDELADRYASGSLLLSRLCPVDYHRFHFPVGGLPGDSVLLNGPLFSVNPIALRQNIQILARNKRRLTILESDSFGQVLLLEIGATCVGSIHQTYQQSKRVEKGDEKGYFRFGGSSTITIFESNRVEFDSDLIEHSQMHREVYARMGDHLGNLKRLDANG